jgi:NADH:ubiquinone oxidoreductase subunit 3 (subunit A)
VSWISPLTLVAPLALFAALLVVALVSKLLIPAPPHPEEHPRNAWRQYHARYALLVLAFVVFDMEMAFMYPWAVAFRSQGIVGFGDMLVFVVILGIALTYMWRTGVLDLERPDE